MRFSEEDRKIIMRTYRIVDALEVRTGTELRLSQVSERALAVRVAALETEIALMSTAANEDRDTFARERGLLIEQIVGLQRAAQVRAKQAVMPNATTTNTRTGVRFTRVATIKAKPPATPAKKAVARKAVAKPKKRK